MPPPSYFDVIIYSNLGVALWAHCPDISTNCSKRYYCASYLVDWPAVPCRLASPTGKKPSEIRRIFDTLALGTLALGTFKVPLVT